jgi:hypothetical protein
VRWFGKGKDDRALDWAGHEQRAGHLASALRSFDRQVSVHMPGDGEVRAAWVQHARHLPPEALSSLLLLLIRQASADGGWSHDTMWRLGELNPRKYTVSDDEATYVLRAAAALPDSYWAGQVMSTALAMATRAQPGDGNELHAALTEFSRSVDARRYLSTPERSKLKRGLTKLAPDETGDAAINTSVIAPADGWATAVLPELSTWHGPSAGINRLLRHLATAPGSKPSAAWLATTRELLGDAEAVRVLRLLLDSLLTAQGENVRGQYGGTINLLLSNHNADLVRSAAWATCTLEEGWVVPALQRIAHRAIHATGVDDYIESAKVPNACIYSLGTIASADAIAALQHLQRTTKHAGFRKQIRAALSAAAERSGVTPSELVERVVPTAGLSETSQRILPVAPEISARVRVTDDGKVVTEWLVDGQWVARAPSGVDAKRYPSVREAVKEVKEVVAGERSRLESLLADDRQWKVPDWQQLYLGHPVTAPIARRLLWTVEVEDESVTGLPSPDGGLVTLDGTLPIPSSATVRLWHPARAATIEVQGWRDRLVRDGSVQPFKQAFREVYLLTPAERETRVYSNRFAAHILRYRQTFALMKERGWVTNFLGPYDGGYDGHARREFADAGLTAVFDHYAVDSDQRYGDVELCSTDRVFFHRAGDRAKEPIPLDTVPELVFSEAMRDVDLFVGVTSIALDPNWGDRGDDPHMDYWQAFSFGELTETASVRRDALARIIPKLKIADRLELGDRFLRVQGRQHTYKIHVGSANIQIEPDDRYLCIVPSTSMSRSKVMLPFDGDQVLSVILSKALLLAADDKIKDPTILQQLPRR